MMDSAAGQKDLQQPTTLNELLRYVVSRFNHPRILNAKRQGAWRSISAQEMASHVRYRALGLYQLGLRAGGHVALLAENSPDWVMSDFSILACNAATVPIYVTQMPQQVEFILKDAGAQYIFIGSKGLYDRVEPVLQGAGLRRVILSDAFARGENITTLAELEELGKDLDKREPDLYDSIRTAVKPSDIAALIYTSGTTATPKGVLLSHSNILSNAIDAGSMIDWHPETDVVLSYLPLSHIFEKMMINLYIYYCLPVYFAESIEAIAQNLLEVRPTMMTTVPRMLEKIYDRVITKGTELQGVKRKLFDWSLRLAREHDPHKGDPFWRWLQLRLASVLVFSKWRAAIGGRIRFFISGSAALNPDLARVFFAAGIPVMQGYGLTETSPVVCVNTFARNRLGSVGTVIPNVRVRIADDGEILVRGPNVMKGFYNAPDATKSVFDGEWFKTGDVGYLDPDGFLYITDRKKDLIKKSSGKFVAPAPIENELRSSRYVEHVAVLGEGRKFAIAIIFPNFVNLSAWATEHGINNRSIAELVTHPDVLHLYESVVSRVNADLNKWERVVKFIVSDHELSVGEGLLTPTMKLRRREIAKRFDEKINALYERFEYVEVHEE